MAEDQGSTESLNGKTDDIADVQKMISDKLKTIEEIGETPIDGKFINNWALGLAVFSFGFLCIGSFLFGATATTSLLRGLGGAILFGALLWLVGIILTNEGSPTEKDND